MNILAIGNSFSQDATAYLHDMCSFGKVQTTVVNLCIGGCSLQTHWENIEASAKDYSYELNGQCTGKMVSIKDTLEEREWDIITIQQASHFSGMAETYYPYAKNISDYLKRHAPHAKQYIHQTWAYELDSTHGGFNHYHCSQTEMYQALKQAYKTIACELELPVIPCGDVIQQLRSHPLFDYAKGGQSLCRDGFHMHLIYGRYVTVAVWYETLTHHNILENAYLPPTEEMPIDTKMLATIKEYVHRLLASV